MAAWDLLQIRRTFSANTLLSAGTTGDSHKHSGEGRQAGSTTPAARLNI